MLESIAEPRGGVATKVEGLEKQAGKRTTLHILQICSALLVLVLGAIEGWYQRADYSADAVSYLDIARAFPKHDWRLVFNALWSSGYPFLIAIVRPFFATDAGGEWLAVHVVNDAILLLTFLAFLYLLRSFFPDLAASSASGLRSKEIFLFVAGLCIFVSTDLCINGASRVGPDPLVDGLFFAAMGAMIRFLRKPRTSIAILLGLILGAGYLVKVIFLPISAIVLLVTLIAVWRKRQNLSLPVLSGIVFALCVLPYAIGLSRAVGYLTFGESGSLNYAFHVNLLPHYTNWQGGPPGLGTPLHPTRMLLKDPPFFEFAEPFHNTYPPYNHMVYWYQGYRHFFSLKYQALAVVRNSYFLAQVLYRQPMSYVMLAVVLALWFLIPFRREWLDRTVSYWPFSLPPLLAVGLYIWVHLEDRYVASFLGCFALLPFVSLCASKKPLSRALRGSVLGILVLTAIGSLWNANGDAYKRALHGQPYTENSEWQLAAYLKRDGLKAGDKVGVIGGPNLHCTWAYLNGLRIVAELGGVPYDPHPVAGVDHWYGYHPMSPDADGMSPDVGGEPFWDASPEMQAKIMQLFKQSGAVAVIAPAKTPDGNLPGWEHVPGNSRWVHRF
jgi:hypothetical protein